MLRRPPVPVREIPGQRGLLLLLLRLPDREQGEEWLTVLRPIRLLPLEETRLLLDRESLNSWLCS
jgi:hypothetical protein